MNGINPSDPPLYQIILNTLFRVCDFAVSFPVILFVNIVMFSFFFIHILHVFMRFKIIWFCAFYAHNQTSYFIYQNLNHSAFFDIAQNRIFCIVFGNKVCILFCFFLFLSYFVTFFLSLIVCVFCLTRAHDITSN
jgi:hypothetical protein